MRRNFSQQFKEQALAHVLDHPQEPMKALAQSLGVGYSTLDEWVRQHKRALGWLSFDCQSTEKHSCEHERAGKQR
jgi:transposase-like protein